ncbi:MAG: hypothetical protein IKG19_03930 [Lachnospiraceae bacterium]|nr:hypothetical protein [Lachnospiraceae bacterium]
MKAFKGYDDAKVYGQAAKLPVGGYVLKIMDAKVEEGKDGKDDSLLISFDIAEGEQKDFFAENYRNQTQEDKKWKGTVYVRIPNDENKPEEQWVRDRFRTFTYALEDSNAGYHWDWDENKLKGKLIGGVFNEREYNFNGRNGFYTRLQQRNIIPVEKIRKGEFSIPDRELLNGSRQKSSDDFVSVSDGAAEDLPF